MAAPLPQPLPASSAQPLPAPNQPQVLGSSMTPYFEPGAPLPGLSTPGSTQSPMPINATHVTPMPSSITQTTPIAGAVQQQNIPPPVAISKTGADYFKTLFGTM